MEVTVVIATCGDDEWQRLAVRRALPSAREETHDIYRVHLPNGTLAEARNHALEHVESDWVCFLDADDELEPGYLEAMATGTADLRAPAVRYVPWGAQGLSNRPAKVPKVVGHMHDCTAECLALGNWLVIGTVARTELVRQAGGFAEWPVYEDWGLFAKLWQLGATVEAIPQAVYRAHVRQASRNRSSLSARAKHEVHQDIARSLGLPVPA